MKKGYEHEKAAWFFLRALNRAHRHLAWPHHLLNATFTVFAAALDHYSIGFDDCDVHGQQM